MFDGYTYSLVYWCYTISSNLLFPWMEEYVMCPFISTDYHWFVRDDLRMRKENKSSYCNLHNYPLFLCWIFIMPWSRWSESFWWGRKSIMAWLSHEKIVSGEGEIDFEWVHCKTESNGRQSITSLFDFASN